MNWRNQLTQLITSFYREDQEQLEKLRCVERCKLSRRWWVLRINCTCDEDAIAVSKVCHLVREPIAQLRLARQIRVLTNGKLVTAIAVNSDASHSIQKQQHSNDADMLL